MAKKKKDFGENSKAVAARGRKAAAKAQQAESSARAEADAYWAAAGEGSRTKAQAKREEAEAKRLEAARKREEARHLAAAEEAALEAASRKAKPARVGGPKVTAHEARLQREAQRKADEAAKEAQQKAAKNSVDEEAYARLVDVQNKNRDDSEIEASNIDQALAALVVEETKEDKHPERRQKAAFLAYKERELPRLREEKPGLKVSQYTEMIFKNWQKSPDNPMLGIR